MEDKKNRIREKIIDKDFKERGIYLSDVVDFSIGNKTPKFSAILEETESYSAYTLFVELPGVPEGNIDVVVSTVYDPRRKIMISAESYALMEEEAFSRVYDVPVFETNYLLSQLIPELPKSKKSGKKK